MGLLGKAQEKKQKLESIEKIKEEKDLQLKEKIRPRGLRWNIC